MTSKKNPFCFLLGGLLVALLVTPIITERFPGIAGLMMTAALLIAVMSLSASKRMYRAGWLLVAAKIVLDVVGYFNPNAGVYIAEAVVLSTFFVLASVFAFRQVLNAEFVDMNRIAGAMSVYMLIGLIWASLYYFVALMDAEAFNGLPDVSSQSIKLMSAAYMDLLYYSYVTLSTLGYGDISPAEPLSRVLVFLEAIVGTFYMAVVIASLIGSHVNRRNINN